MKKHLLKSMLALFVMVFSAGNLFAEPIAPKVSSGTTEHWYQVVFQRPNANLALEDQGDGEILEAGSFVFQQENQLWKLEAIEGEEGIYKMTAKSGRTIYYGDNYFRSGSAVTGIRLVVSTNTDGYGANAWELQRENSSTMAMNPFGGSVVGAPIGEWYVGDGGNPVKFINARTMLAEKINEVQELIDNTDVGTRFGQVESTFIDLLNMALADANDYYADPSTTDAKLLEILGELNDFVGQFASAKISELPSLLSESPAKYRWYKLQNRVFKNKYITTEGVVLNGSVQIVEVNLDEYAMWRFELSEDESSVKMINKATEYSVSVANAAHVKMVSEDVATALNIYPQGNYYAIGPVEAEDKAYMHTPSDHDNLVTWTIDAEASHWSFVFVEETDNGNIVIPEGLEVSVSSSDDELGTASIEGVVGNVAEVFGSVTVMAAPMPGSVFVNWTNALTEEVVSLSAKYLFTPETDVALVANFEKLGKVGDPYVSTPERPVYYYIQSASDGSQVFNGYTGDFRSHVMISPENPGFVQHDVVDFAPTTNHMLWQIVDVDGDLMLKNRATGLFMRESHSVGTTGTGFVTMLIDPDFSQYAIRGADQPSFGISWQSNLMSRLSDNFVALNGLTAWYFVVEPNSMRNYNTTTGVAKDFTNLPVYVNNGVIQVDGVDVFEVYTVNGLKVNSKQALQSGVYIVKAGEMIQKVLVK